MSARNENYHSIIKKNFKKRVILIDRFVDSTIAYQHFWMGIIKSLINKLNIIILNIVYTIFTFLYITEQLKSIKSIHKDFLFKNCDKWNGPLKVPIYNQFLI